MKYTSSNIHTLENYTRINLNAEVDSANPWRLVQMLMEGALNRISAARAELKRKDISTKGENISRAISIIGGLRDSLDHKAGGELSKNLDIMYEYMTYRLIEANRHNSDEMLGEVAALLAEIKFAWDEIGKDQTLIGDMATEFKQQSVG